MQRSGIYRIYNKKNDKTFVVKVEMIPSVIKKANQQGWELLHSESVFDNQAKLTFQKIEKKTTLNTFGFERIDPEDRLPRTFYTVPLLLLAILFPLFICLCCPITFAIIPS